MCGGREYSLLALVWWSKFCLFPLVSDLCTFELMGSWMEFAAMLIGDNLRLRRGISRLKKYWEEVIGHDTTQLHITEDMILDRKERRSRIWVEGKKVLWKHSVYGLTPNIGSAHHLLLFAKQHNDVKLLVEIMNLVKKNDLILQPGTADIVFSICSQTDNWDLICKYGKRFVKAGVKLRKTSLDTWMEFASKIGDVDALWKIEKIRSEAMKEHTLGSGLSCAKGFLIDHKPEDAAAIIQLLNQTVPDSRRQKFMVELQKLVADWPLEVIKRQKDERKKELAATLQNDIPTMLSALLNMGLKLNVNVEDLTRRGLLS